MFSCSHDLLSVAVIISISVRKNGLQNGKNSGIYTSYMACIIYYWSSFHNTELPLQTLKIGKTVLNRDRSITI